MGNKHQNLSVIDIAEMCGVARSTVSYWIEKKELPAHKKANKYMVSFDDLFLFLKSEKRGIPQILLEYTKGAYFQSFMPLKRCWEYWTDDIHQKYCLHCNAFKKNIHECFTLTGKNIPQPLIICHTCTYFREYFSPRIAFIDQIERPAAIYKDLYLWAGNNEWADICGTKLERLVGMGIEEVIHPDSLRLFINYNKKNICGNNLSPRKLLVSLINNLGGKTEVYLTINDLKIPSGAYLAIAEKINNT